MSLLIDPLYFESLTLTKYKVSLGLLAAGRSE